MNLAPPPNLIYAASGWGHDSEIPQTREESYHQNWTDEDKPLSGNGPSMFNTMVDPSEKFFSSNVARQDILYNFDRRDPLNEHSGFSFW